MDLVLAIGLSAAIGGRSPALTIVPYAALRWSNVALSSSRERAPREAIEQKELRYEGTNITGSARRDQYTHETAA